MKDTENNAGSEAIAAFNRLSQFVEGAVPALEDCLALYLANSEINRLVGTLNNAYPKRPLSDEDADRLLGLAFAIEAAHAHALDAGRSLRYLAKHLPELGELVNKLEELAASRTSPDNDTAGES
jgi:hypothetical protein